MTNLSKTLFVPFYFRYKESLSYKNIYDREAVDFFSKNNDQIVNFNSFKDDVNTFTGTIARTILIDEYLLLAVKKLQDKSAKFNIINIGCGLDFRNRRLHLDNIPIINVDLQEVLKFREKYFGVKDNEINRVGDITKINEWNFIPKGNNIFILEGILTYFSETIVKRVFKSLKEKSNNSIFIFEVLPKIEKNVEHPTISKISKDLQINWGCNNILGFVNDLGFEYIDSKSTTSLLNDRWDFKVLDPLLGDAKEVLNNHRIVLMKS